ncbi:MULTISPECIES: hypothetical protein [unclassified Agarivorans]|uniref:hypothetical protein n=1 Tax=unclassified Agarivorans TaxID=2636026 RepID=UPI0010EB258B|nr:MULTISPECIES: hypothetical protein [unclassified Agarivorans]MDO6684907.1 hypothetical protein [Agarivorans sp. 3_MG-2023]MDO6714932.1 hypothetical protein [Agarivorans sp. 2_MG-2023]GDY27474.1 hypothetical protein AHAT_33640 [Agarivorans sp. Toyoura001]
MKIQGLGQPIPQQTNVKKATSSTELSVATKAPKGIVPWAVMDESSVEKLRYDQNVGSGGEAVSQYQDVANQLKRQQVNEMFGIDLFA